MMIAHRAINALAILDAIAHTCVINAECQRHEKVEIVASSSLDQPVDIQVTTLTPGGEATLNVGDPFTVAALTGQESRLLTQDTSGLHRYYNLSAQCAVAPAAGTLTVTMYFYVKESS